MSSDKRKECKVELQAFETSQIHTGKTNHHLSTFTSVDSGFKVGEVVMTLLAIIVLSIRE